MRCLFRVFLSCAVIAAIHLLSLRASAEELRNAAGHWRMETPKHWVKMGQAKMAQFKPDVNDPNVTMHDGFEQVVMRPGFEVAPFFLIMEDRSPRHPFHTHDMIERTMHDEFRKLAGIGAKVGAIKHDRQKNRVTGEFEMTTPDGRKLQGLTYLFLGKDSIVVVQCFAMENDYPQAKATFDAMADSFRYDDGFQFVPFSVAKAGWICAGVCGGALCLGVVLITGLLLLFKLKAKK